MASRWYVSRVIGSGTENNPFRTEIQDVPGVQRVSAAINSNPDGRPEHQWTICRVKAPLGVFTEIDNLTRVINLGSILSGTSTITSTKRTALRTKLRALGEDIDTTDLTVRKLVLRLIRRHYRHVKQIEQAFPR